MPRQPSRPLSHWKPAPAEPCHKSVTQSSLRAQRFPGTRWLGLCLPLVLILGRIPHVRTAFTLAVLVGASFAHMVVSIVPHKIHASML